MWKQKGEEYRLTATPGWFWINKLRQSNPTPQDSLGLRTVARKLKERKEKIQANKSKAGVNSTPEKADETVPILEKLKAESEETAMEVDSTESVSKEEKSDETEAKEEETVVEEKPELIDVEHALANRTYYPRVTKPYARLDALLDRRLKQVEAERRQKSAIIQVCNQQTFNVLKYI